MLSDYLLGCIYNFVFSKTKDDIPSLNSILFPHNDYIVMNDKYICNLSELAEQIKKEFPVSEIRNYEGINYMEIVDTDKKISNTLEDYKINYNFISGIVDTCSTILYVKDDFSIEIFSSKDMLKSIENFIKIPCVYTENTKDEKYSITYHSVNAVDFLSLLKISKKLSELNKFLCGNYNFPKCQVKLEQGAIMPSKNRLSDAGYDIHIFKKVKQINNTTALYDTGVSLIIPNKYYVEVVPRSSLVKSGYILTNSIGIIDVGYRGNIYIALTKIAENAIDIESNFPFRCCQLLFKKQYYVDLEETDQTTQTTSRDKGGYGSTG